MPGMKSFYECTRAEITSLLDRPRRAAEVYTSVYRDWTDGFQKVEALPARCRTTLSDQLSLGLPAIEREFESADGTCRYLLRLEDGQLAESVFIPRPERFTICISSQVGCALACSFCLTGQLGLIRNLTPGEIVSQVVLLQRLHDFRDAPRQFSVVLMGMGEPLHNYDSVLKAIRILHDDHGLKIPMTRITLSTAGLVPEIERLGAEPMFPNLSVSLTGATNPVRDVLMPINRKYPIEQLIAAIRALPASRQKRVMFEYVVIKDVTDALDDARSLARWLSGMCAKVNLIPLNPAKEIAFERPDDGQILQFQEVLLKEGVTTFIRKNRGGDVYGACGQLKQAVGIRSRHE